MAWRLCSSSVSGVSVTLRMCCSKILASSTELSAADVLWMYSLVMNHEVFVSKVNSWNIHVVMIHNICLCFAPILKWGFYLGEASPSQTALFCSFCGPLKGSCWKCSKLFLDLHRAFAFFWREVCPGGEYLYWSLCTCRFRKYNSLHWEFSAFHPAAVSARNGGWAPEWVQKGERGMMRKRGVCVTLQ